MTDCANHTFEVFISAKGLMHKSFFASKPSCFALVTINSGAINSTEVIYHSSDPNWTTQFKFDYIFSEVQNFCIEIFDLGESTIEDVDAHTLLGSAVFLLSDLVSSPTLSLTKRLGNKTVISEGSITVKTEAIADTHDILDLSMSVADLPRLEGLFSSCDPFITISRHHKSDDSWIQVWRSAPMKDVQAASWDHRHIPIQLLCNGDFDRELKVDIRDWNKKGKHVWIGSVNLTIRSVLNSQQGSVTGATYPIVSSDSNRGKFSINSASIERHPTFLGFLRGGCKLSMVVGIDFTIANGEPSDPGSYHHWDYTGESTNLYEHTIKAIGGIIENYDSDKKFPVYGFGAKVRDKVGHLSPTQHWFSLMPDSSEVNGVDGILHAYRSALPTLTFDGPCRLSPIIQHMAHAVTHNESIVCTQDHLRYTVLLLITAGGVSDVEDTIAAVVEASHCPLSIVIVGVGDADFEDMRVLDADEISLMSGGAAASRDIIQFVQLRDFRGNETALAASVLEEIPEQLTSYMTSMGFLPSFMS